MQSHYAAQFTRDMACTEAEWLMWLPAALGDVPWQRTGAAVSAQIGAGSLHLSWHAQEPRRIALMSLPRLAVQFAFEGLDDQERYRFMKRFDLYMQRGGG
jgi:hypothetical protein